MTQRNTHYGMGVFTLIWLGQLASLVGSGLTSFALSTTVYKTSESVVQYGLVLV